MSKLQFISQLGGCFAILTLIHFFVDWIFQSHNEAMVKHNNWKVRAKHCAIYTLPFIVFLYWYGLSHIQLLFAASILFFSHFVEDTYLPVFYWAKYVRKPPQMKWKIVNVDNNIYLIDPNVKIINEWYLFTQKSRQNRDMDWRNGILHLCQEDVNEYKNEYGNSTLNKKHLKLAQNKLDREGFIEFIDTTLGKLLMIVIDQLIHLCFLLPIVYIMIK